MGSWFKAVKSGATVEISIFGQFGDGGSTAKEFAELWSKATAGSSRVQLYINSPGGNVTDAAAIFNLIKRTAATVTVYIEGAAWSAASWIAMAADRIVMRRNSTLMIHNPMTITLGDHNDHAKTIESLEAVKAGMVRDYAAKSQKSVSEISQIMDAETWYTPYEAVAAGFADEVDEVLEVAASFDVNAWRKRYSAAGRPQKEVTMQPQENPAYALYKEYYATFRNYNGYEHEKAHRMACGAAQYVPNELDRAVERQQNPELYAMFDQMQRMYMNQGHDETTATRRAKAYCGMQ